MRGLNNTEMQLVDIYNVYNPPTSMKTTGGCSVADFSQKPNIDRYILCNERYLAYCSGDSHFPYTCTGLQGIQEMAKILYHIMLAKLGIPEYLHLLGKG
jgi:hypothetical protein